MNSRFVTGLGATRFTGPLTWSAVSRKRIAAISSSMRDPAGVLPPAAEPAAEAELEDRQLQAQGAALAGEHDPGAQWQTRMPAATAAARRGLPVADDVGQEAVAARAVLVEGPVAGVAVEADGAAREQHLRQRAKAWRASRRAGVVLSTRLSRIVRS